MISTACQLKHWCMWCGCLLLVHSCCVHQQSDEEKARARSKEMDGANEPQSHSIQAARCTHFQKGK